MKSLVLLSLVFTLLSCKGGGGGGGIIGAVQPVVVNYGIYERCENFQDDGASVKRQFMIYESGMTENITAYTGLNCPANSVEFSNRLLFSYSKTATNTYRLVVEGYTNTSVSAADLSYNNTNSYCGLTGWTANVPRNTLGRNCEGEFINQHDYQDITVSQNGANLDFNDGTGTYTYIYTGGFNFTAQGQTLTNGSYTLFNGAIGMHTTLNNGNYTIVYYDPASSKYFTETGTYTSANNSSTFTATNYTPACGNDVGVTDTYPISTTSNSLAIQFPEASIILEKVSFNAATFQTAFLGGSYTAGCF